MPIQLRTLVDRLNTRLNTEDYTSIDPSANGLQVGDASTKRAVNQVSFAVDAALESIEYAAEADSDVLVVHHGLIWHGLDRVTGRAYRRIAALLTNDIALYVAHLPLDGHPAFGNAAQLAEILGLSNTEPFGRIESEPIGRYGRISTGSITIQELTKQLETELTMGGQPIQVLEFGPTDIEEIAIVTGSGADWLDEAESRGVDVFITGEGKQQLYHEAKEAGITVVLAGHYATETVGLKALQAFVDEWPVTTTFIDIPTGL